MVQSFLVQMITMPASLRGRVMLKEGYKMKYVVKIGVSQEIKFVFDNMGDALDFITICWTNGYRATVVPVGEDYE